MFLSSTSNERDQPFLSVLNDMVSVLTWPKNEVFDKLGARSVKISAGLINLLVILGIQAYSCKGDVLLIALFLDLIK